MLNSAAVRMRDDSSLLKLARMACIGYLLPSPTAQHCETIVPSQIQFVREVHVASVFSPDPVPGAGAEFSLGKDAHGRVYVRVCAWAEITHQIRDAPLDEFLKDPFYPEDIKAQVRAAAESDASWIWSHPPELVRLAEVLSRAKEDAASVPDDELVNLVRATYWGTDSWSWVEMSLAVISAVCALRPHLAAELIADPISAMIQGGLTDENDIIAQGTALAKKETPYVPLTEVGRRWLLQDWPSLENMAKDTFRRELIELTK